MATNTNLVFYARAESTVFWGRSLTTEEITSIRVKKGSMMAAGNFGSFPGPQDIATYQWVSENAANEWVAFCNTFTPAPESATVSLIAEPTE